jgi:hypothetical protein
VVGGGLHDHGAVAARLVRVNLRPSEVGAPARALSYQKLTVRLGPLLALADSLVVHTLFFFASWRFAALYGGLCSTSWDEEVEGSFLGTAELKVKSPLLRCPPNTAVVERLTPLAPLPPLSPDEPRSAFGGPRARARERGHPRHAGQAARLAPCAFTALILYALQRPLLGRERERERERVKGTGGATGAGRRSAARPAVGLGAAAG